MVLCSGGGKSITSDAFEGFRERVGGVTTGVAEAILGPCLDDGGVKNAKFLKDESLLRGVLLAVESKRGERASLVEGMRNTKFPSISRFDGISTSSAENGGTALINSARVKGILKQHGGGGNG